MYSSADLKSAIVRGGREGAEEELEGLGAREGWGLRLLLMAGTGRQAMKNWAGLLV